MKLGNIRVMSGGTPDGEGKKEREEFILHISTKKYIHPPRTVSPSALCGYRRPAPAGSAATPDAPDARCGSFLVPGMYQLKSPELLIPSYWGKRALQSPRYRPIRLQERFLPSPWPMALRKANWTLRHSTGPNDR